MQGARRRTCTSIYLFTNHAHLCDFENWNFNVFSRPKFETRKLKRPQLLYQAVQDEVKAYIIEHALAPGDALPPETELA